LTDDKIFVSFHVTCQRHERCVIYYAPDVGRNRLRGRATHVRAWTLFNGVANDEVMEVMVKLPNVTVREPIFWSKEELRKARGY
jgi:hypothetical protein